MSNYIFKSKVANHQQIKNKLLEQINLIPLNPLQDKGQNIFHTDWNIPTSMHREYETLFVNTVKPHLIDMAKTLNCNHFEINKFWFQRYGANGHHTWHCHPATHFSNVYFLECPEGSSTKFKDLNADCEEGDILSFPAFLPHMSPSLPNDSVKTVIAFNTDFNIM